MKGRVCNRYALRKESANKTNYFALRYKDKFEGMTRETPYSRPVQNVQNNGVQANTSLYWSCTL